MKRLAFDAVNCHPFGSGQGASGRLDRTKYIDDVSAESAYRSCSTGLDNLLMPAPTFGSTDGPGPAPSLA